MLLLGLRSKEVVALNPEESRICLHGKGNKLRTLPLYSDAVHLLDHQLGLERPTACGQALFVSLKGPARGARITPAGFRWADYGHELSWSDLQCEFGCRWTNRTVRSKALFLMRAHSYGAAALCRSEQTTAPIGPKQVLLGSRRISSGGL
jgi:integrase